MEHRIGEIVTLPDGRKAKVVEGLCPECCFHMRGFEVFCYAPREWKCMKVDRTDHKNIIYKEIKGD